MKKRTVFRFINIALSVLVVVCLGFYLYIPRANYGFSREVSDQESQLRLEFVETSTAWLGTTEGSADHHTIIDTYNSHIPLAQNYMVTYEDDWCATFVSFTAIRSDMTGYIPTECSCERQIRLWQDMGRWEEDDIYLPLPGDIIYYDWDERTLGDSTGWSDHVGIVVGTYGPFIKVIEGNKDNAVGYRYIIRWDPRIRGYGLPEY